MLPSWVLYCSPVFVWMLNCHQTVLSTHISNFSPSKRHSVSPTSNKVMAVFIQISFVFSMPTLFLAVYLFVCVLIFDKGRCLDFKCSFYYLVQERILEHEKLITIILYTYNTLCCPLFLSWLHFNRFPEIKRIQRVLRIWRSFSSNIPILSES